jgi:transposase-like protein
MDIHLAMYRDKHAAKRFLSKAIHRHGMPAKMTINGRQAKAAAIARDNATPDTTMAVSQTRPANHGVLRGSHDSRRNVRCFDCWK